MIRLLCVHQNAERGGSDQALLRMVRSLPQPEFQCHVVLPARSPLDAQFRQAGATLHTMPMHRLSRSHGPADWLSYAAGWPLTVARLVGLIRRVRADVVHTNSLHSLYGWAAAALTRRPHVWHAREIVVQSRGALRLERFLARHFAARVIAMSEAIAQQLDRRRLVVIREVPDPSEFHPGLAGRFRPAAAIPDDAPLIGAVGRIDTWKGLDVLLDAFALASARRPELRLVVAGGPVPGKEQFNRSLARRAAGMAGVHWLGPTDDVPLLLADLDLLVLPSTAPEPYGLVVVEALASGVRAVVTDAGGPPEILAMAAPGAGSLVPPGDRSALAEAMVATAPRATSTATRRARVPLCPATPETRFATVFRDAVADHRGSARRRCPAPA